MIRSAAVKISLSRVRARAGMLAGCMMVMVLVALFLPSSAWPAETPTLPAGILRLAYWDGYTGRYPYPVSPFDEAARTQIVAEQVREMQVMRSAFDGFVLNVNLLYPYDYDGRRAPSISRLEPVLAAAGRLGMKVILDIGNIYTPLTNATHWNDYFRALAPLEGQEALVGWKLQDEAGSYGARAKATREDWQGYFRLAREHFKKPIGIDLITYYYVDRVLSPEKRNEVYRRGLLGGFPPNRAAATMRMDIEDIGAYLQLLNFIMFAPHRNISQQDGRPFVSDEDVIRDARRRWGNRLQMVFTRGGLYYTYQRKSGVRLSPKAEYDPEGTRRAIAEQYRQVKAAGGAGVVQYAWNYTYDFSSSDAIRVDRIPGYPDPTETVLLRAYSVVP